MEYLKKKDYGQVPEYIEKVKENIQNEYKMIQNLHEQHNQQKYVFINIKAVPVGVRGQDPEGGVEEEVEWG